MTAPTPNPFPWQSAEMQRAHQIISIARHVLPALIRTMPDAEEDDVINRAFGYGIWFADEAESAMYHAHKLDKEFPPTPTTEEQQ
jgi:hypothetical protein